MDYYRKVKSFDGLECSIDAKFKLNGKPKKVIYCGKTYGNQKATARIVFVHKGEKYYFQASKLIAEAWIPKYDIDNDYIIYKDGNCHNIHLDTLQVVTKKVYYKWLLRNTVNVADDVEQRKSKLRQVAKEAMLTCNYFETLDMSEINRHVTDVLYKKLIVYCKETLFLGTSTTMSIVPDCLARMYEVIMNGMCLYNYERYCKKLLLNYKKKGTFGLTGKIPKQIQINVQQLNLDCLWEMYPKEKKH